MYDTETKSTKFSRDIKWADWHGGKSPTDKIKEIEMPTMARLKEGEWQVDQTDDEEDQELLHIVSDDEDEESVTTKWLHQELRNREQLTTLKTQTGKPHKAG